MRDLSQHLYLPEKVVTIDEADALIYKRGSQHLYLPEKVVTHYRDHPGASPCNVAAPVPS